MRSFVLPLAVLAASVLAAPAPGVDCTTKGNTVIEFYDVTVTEVVYMTEGSVPSSTSAPAVTTRRKKHSHKPKPTSTSSPVYYAPAPQPAPTENVVTITYGYEQPAASSPAAYTPAASSPAAPAHTEVSNSPAPAPETKPNNSGNLAQDMVDIHNYYRNKYGVPSLAWDSDLASYAEGHTGSCQMAHTGGPYGENLAQGYSDAVKAVDAWYGEYNQYSYAAATFSGSSGHFTQVIWKGTEKIGCHLRDCNGRPYLMCEYHPPGNMLGSFTENVPQLESGYSAL